MKKILYILFSFIVAQNAPVSDAGLDQIVQMGEVVTLNGSNSYDPDGGEITFDWSTSENISLSSTTEEALTFTAPNNLDTLIINLSVTDSEELTSQQYSASDIFISEYHDGSSPNQYIEIYNGTEGEVDLTGYELWILKSENDMTWDPIYNSEDDEWDTDFWVLLFNSDTSMTDINPHQALDGDVMQRVNVESLESGETLMIMREGEGEDFEFIGRNYAVWDRLVKISGDEPIALRRNGIIIDQVGDDENVGSSGWDVGADGTTKDHTLIRKGTIVSGNTDWISSSESEWDVYENDTFEDVFNHNCTSCDDEVVIYVSSPPVAVPSYITDGLLIGESGDICDMSVTLDASSSTTVTGDLSYQWRDDNNLIDSADLTNKQPSFSTVGIASDSYEFGLTVYDGLLYSNEVIVNVPIADNLCPHAVLNVVVLSDEEWVEQYPSMVLFDNEEFTDVGNGVWDEDETFYDIGDFQFTEGEDYIDVHGNGQWDESEPYVDTGDGIYTEGEQFDDIGDGVYNDGEEFVDINNNNVWDDSQIIFLSALNSIEPDGEDLTYSWSEISGLLGDDGIINVEDDESIISFTRPDFGEEGYGEVEFSLSVSDGSETSLPDTLTIRFGRPIAPDVPLLLSRVEHQFVVLSWDSSAEESEDYLTGYYDFEGYKLYKSTNGGQTWGTESDKIYDDTGTFVGWKPYRQWDLDEDQDMFHCNYSSDYCSDNNRNINVSGYDPYSYWLNIGENSGILYSFVDSVLDGVEYTYALTSYDTGIWTTYQDPGSGEILWYDSNPNYFIDTDGEGFPTMECEIDTETEKNFVTLSSGYYASNVLFPDATEGNVIFTADSLNNGNAFLAYELVNLDDLEPIEILFEVQAKEGDNNAFEGLSTFNPTLYAYYLSEDGSASSVEEIPYAGLLNAEIDSLLDLPGTYLDVEDNMIVKPEYEIEDMEIKFFDDLGSGQNWTDFLSGTRMLFLNPWREYGHAVDVFNISDLSNIIFYEGSGADYYAPIIGESYFPDSNNNKLRRNIYYNLKFNYNNTQDTFDNRPPYRYQVEFSKTASYEAYEVLQESGANAVYECSNSETNTLLPFRVKNLTTGRYVGLRHVDQGFNNGGDDDQPLYAPAGGCEEEGSDNYTGDCDCVWTMYEDVIFVEDTVTTKYNTTPHGEITYSLELSYPNFVYYTFLDEEPWSENYGYDEGQEVLYGGTKWEASTDINPGVIPGTAYDPDGDGVDNGNPWVAIYPWSEFQADSITLVIEPWTWFADGDKWTADLSQLGQETDIDSGTLSEVSISPNPYLRHSGYNESSGEHKLRFSKLPNECEINIFTVSGERVRTIKFNDNGYYGNYFWDQKNAHGETVAPGLYIYTVEAKSNNKNHKHIGKFAIVR